MKGNVLEAMEAALGKLDEAERALGKARMERGTKEAAKLADNRDAARAALGALATPDALWALVAVARAAVTTMKAGAAPATRAITAAEEAEWAAD